MGKDNDVNSICNNNNNNYVKSDNEEQQQQYCIILYSIPRSFSKLAYSCNLI